MDEMEEGTCAENSYDSAVRSVWSFGTCAEDSLPDIEIPKEFDTRTNRTYADAARTKYHANANQDSERYRARRPSSPGRNNQQPQTKQHQLKELEKQMRQLQQMMSTLQADIAADQKVASEEQPSPPTDAASRNKSGTPSTITDSDKRTHGTSQEMETKIQQYMAPFMTKLHEMCQEREQLQKM